jgi:GxxExxY protein
MKKRVDIHPEWTDQVISAAVEVHRVLGAGLLESAYQTCLAHELRLRGIPFERQVPLPITYKGLDLDSAYRLDLFVQGRLIVEIKAVERVSPIHTAQLLTYLRLKKLPLGLLINFNVELVAIEGVHRILNRRALDGNAPSDSSVPLL